MRWVRVDHPFSFLARSAALYYLSLFFLYLFASFSPRLRLDYARKNRKSWPALQHRFIYIFLSPFSRVRLASDPFCSGFSSSSISFWSNGLPAILTKWRNRPFIVILSADRLFAKRNFNWLWEIRTRYLHDRAHLTDLSEKYKNFNFLPLIWRLYPKKYMQIQNIVISINFT